MACKALAEPEERQGHVPGTQASKAAHPYVKSHKGISRFVAHDGAIRRMARKP